MWASMAIGFDRQSKKDAKGASSASHQLSGRRQKELLPPPMRSPALESLERGKSRHAGRRQLHRPTKRPVAPGRKVRYAAEEALARPAMPRKSLPRRGLSIGKQGKQGRTGLTAGRRLPALWEPARQTAPVQVISQEEQEKLAALELDMRLPRVAGKLDSWLLITVLALLCIGLVMVYSASSV